MDTGTAHMTHKTSLLAQNRIYALSNS